MTTLEIFFEQFGRQASINCEDVRAHHFPELGPEAFKKKLFAGELGLPGIFFRDSQKASAFIDIRDLASWYDAQRATALRNLERLSF